MVSKESASEDASIASYNDFESDPSAVGRLRRRAFGGNLGILGVDSKSLFRDLPVVKFDKK